MGSHQKCAGNRHLHHRHRRHIFLHLIMTGEGWQRCQWVFFATGELDIDIFFVCAHLIPPFIDRICFGQVSLNPTHSNSPHTSFYELRLLQASAQTDFNSWRSSPFSKLIKRGGESVPHRKTELKPREGWLYKIYWVDPNILPSHLMKENEVREYTPRFYNFKHFRSSFVFR